MDPALDLAHLAYTGGTTGVSKGVELTHRHVVTNVLQSACWVSGSVPELDGDGDATLRQVPGPEEQPVRLGEGRIVVIAPWFHAMGVIGYLNCLVTAGTTAVVHLLFDPVRYLEDAVRYWVTSFSGAPPVLSAPLPVPLVDRRAALLPDAVIGEGYGLTEVTMQATGGPAFRSGTRKPGTVGVPVFDTEITIRTGDVGVLDDDGYLAIVDRTKDMLLHKGCNVYPRELEEHLFDVPGVGGAAVVAGRTTRPGSCRSPTSSAGTTTPAPR